MKNDPNSFTLAVGDGANDVNMIQSAHVGIGIMGKEGNQATAFSDYSIPNYQGLRRILLWHGRNFGVNALVYLALCLFKSQIFIMPLLLQNFINGSSGASIFFAFYYSLYNVWNTVFSLGFFALLD